MAEPSLDLLKAIAHPSRYAILDALGEGELNVGQIETATGIGQPALSQQLSVLRNAGLVATRREAKLVFYATERDALDEAVGLLVRLRGREDTSRAAPSGEARDFARKGGAAVFARLD